MFGGEFTGAGVAGERADVVLVVAGEHGLTAGDVHHMERVAERLRDREGLVKDAFAVIGEVDRCQHGGPGCVSHDPSLGRPGASGPDVEGPEQRIRRPLHDVDQLALSPRAGTGGTISAVTMNARPFSVSAWVRMWQW